MPDPPSHTVPVAIVGGGPVGLFLGICLQKAGVPSLILEQRAAPSSNSRSLGIHPPALELFKDLGMADQLISRGVRIKKGHAYSSTGKMGSLSFDSCPPPFNFILSLPQSQTEQLLEHELRRLNSQSIIRKARVTGIKDRNNKVTLTYRTPEGEHTLRAQYLIGCDGKNSFIRQQAGIPFEGYSYPDTYVMGDFTDNTEFGTDAAVFLCDEGLIESFPLPDNRRRWVVKTGRYHSSPRRTIIEEAVRQRISHSLSHTDHFMLSSFGVQKRIARPMVQNRLILAGDAAHVVSPIGGQGMNLGWLGARQLADCLRTILICDLPGNDLLYRFQQDQIKAVNNAIARSEFNMRLGRKAPFPALRNATVSWMLLPPFAPLMARLFTMHGLRRWII
ncbi:FAD-dependent oxidoreductase [Fodinibius sediminis]|uniref:2-polyprenyl-6-methoxyphenol hydroxylase n=1 Tax=Fodinibius sediminis TaxID=1214077 RepID=A0A521CN78_9BACT|nr:NAD(P)/FAD-dependent oxidoreductase [Fodinibius sediminis]SMO60848.1 2-polyprenyl-6-methoxyphenol hydroxylase [Fodinibius sediminis]